MGAWVIGSGRDRVPRLAATLLGVLVGLAGCGDPGIGRCNPLEAGPLVCIDEAVHRTDGCGRARDLVTRCGAGATCVRGACVEDVGTLCAREMDCGSCTRTYPCGYCDDRCVAASEGPPPGCATWAWESEACHSSSDAPFAAFAAARAWPLGAGIEQVIEGALTDEDPFDVYALGPLHAGDRLAAVAEAPGPRLGVGLFDSAGRLVFLADYGIPQVTLILPRRVDPAFLVVAELGPGPPRTYRLTALRTPGAGTHEQHPQDVYLDFDGATAVRIANRAPVDVAPFDAAQISPELADETDELLALAVAKIRADFHGANVRIFASTEGPASAHASTVYYGGSAAGLLGLADRVDELNREVVESAMVFTDAFQVFNGLEPTLEEYATALANVSSHEIGHLVGLQHTGDPRDLMDTTASVRQTLRDQSFSAAPLFRAVFPTGWQDSVALLVDGVGGDPAVLYARGAPSFAPAPAEPPDGPAARDGRAFSSSDL